MIAPMRVVLVVAVTALVAASTVGAAPRVRTLATASGRIVAFAQDGRFLAWASTSKSCGQVVQLYDLARRKTTVLTRPGTPGCRMTATVSQLAVATSGATARALWARYETGNNFYYWLYAGSTASPRERDEGLISESTGDELRVSIAGSGPFLGVGWAHAAEDLNANLPYTILDGGVKRLGADLKLTTVPQMPAVAAMAAGGGTVAIVPRGQVGRTTSPRATLTAIEVRAASSLALRTNLTTQQTIGAVATSASLVTARVPFAIETFRLDDRPSPRVPVPLGATDVRTGSGRVVYRLGRAIYETGRKAPIAVAATTPVGLSVDGRRLTWAENPGGRGRVRALTLP
jgi:hypothetical protein